MTIAYHASHEQFAPSELLKYAVLAEDAGFDAIHSSDHFHPWSVNQGNSGYSFSWIAAAMQATSIPFSMVCAPGQRYHPAIVAQAIATIAEMFPNRYSIELGSGEALNECITGDEWPDKQIRNERLLQSTDIIRKLLYGEEVTFKGHVQIKEAKLYSLPATVPPLFCAAISIQTCGWAGSWADGLLTTGAEMNEVMEKKKAFEKNGGSGKPFFVQYAFSFAGTKELAIAGAHDQWKTNLLPSNELADLYKPQHFDKKAAGVTMEETAQKMNLVTSMKQLHTIIAGYKAAGADRLILHNVNRNQEEFIAAFKKYH
jgi:probable non-F420 flavinoid oxidoreductase